MRRNSYSDKLWVAANQNIKAKNFWLKQLSGEPVKSHFPYDHDYRGKKRGTINTLTFEFTGELFSKLKKISANSDIKLHIILTAGLMVLLQKYTDNIDIITGTSIYKPQIEGEKKVPGKKKKNSAGKINTKVHFFKAREETGAIDAEKWTIYCRDPVRLYEIPGDHVSILKIPKAGPFAKLFGNVIRGTT